MPDNYDGPSGGEGGSTSLDSPGGDPTGENSGNSASGGADTGENNYNTGTGNTPNNDWQKYTPPGFGTSGYTGNPVTYKAPVLDKFPVTGKMPVNNPPKNNSNNVLPQPYQFQTVTYGDIGTNPVLAGKSDVLASKGMVTAPLSGKSVVTTNPENSDSLPEYYPNIYEDNKNKPKGVADWFTDEEKKSDSQEEQKDIEIVVICIPGSSEELGYKPHDGQTAGKTHYIVKNSMKEASEQLNKYLSKISKNKVNKIVFDVHGSQGFIRVRNTKKTIHKNGYTTEVGTAYMGLAEFKAPTGDTMPADVAGLKNILKKVEDNGMAVFLACLAAVGEDGINLGKEMHKVNINTNLYLSQAFDNGVFGEGGVGLYYHHYYDDIAIITWGHRVRMGDKIYTNTKPNGYRKYPVGVEKDINLGSDGTHDGNLTIAGNLGIIKETALNEK